MDHTYLPRQVKKNNEESKYVTFQTQGSRKYPCIFFTIVHVALPVSTYLYVVCCNNICLVLLFQGHVACQKCTLTGPLVLVEKPGCSWMFSAIPALKFQPLNFLFSRTRQENKAKGLAFLRAGNRQQALECFQKCVDISPEMALEVIKVLVLFRLFFLFLTPST